MGIRLWALQPQQHTTPSILERAKKNHGPKRYLFRVLIVTSRVLKTSLSNNYRISIPWIPITLMSKIPNIYTTFLILILLITYS